MTLQKSNIEKRTAIGRRLICLRSIVAQDATVMFRKPANRRIWCTKTVVGGAWRRPARSPAFHNAPFRSAPRLLRHQKPGPQSGTPGGGGGERQPERDIVECRGHAAGSWAPPVADTNRRSWRTTTVAETKRGCSKPVGHKRPNRRSRCIMNVRGPGMVA